MSFIGTNLFVCLILAINASIALSSANKDEGKRRIANSN
jgi:hypothetical protein